MADRENKVVLVTGGARSGKSAFALRLGEEGAGRKVLIATAEILRNKAGEVLDPEMAERIRRHRESRSKRWKTVEEPIKLPDAIARWEKRSGGILVDCLTLWLSNLLCQERDILGEMSRLSATLRRVSTQVVLVTNEVGLGIIPDHPLGRRFVDLAGTMNREVAGVADAVYCMVSGIPVKVK